MARMGSRLWGPWQTFGARTDDIDGTTSFHFLHINLILRSTLCSTSIVDLGLAASKV